MTMWRQFWRCGKCLACQCNVMWAEFVRAACIRGTLCHRGVQFLTNNRFRELTLPKGAMYHSNITSLLQAGNFAFLLPYFSPAILRDLCRRCLKIALNKRWYLCSWTQIVWETEIFNGDTSKFVRAIVFQNKRSPVLLCSSKCVVFNIHIESLATSKGMEKV